MSGNSAGQPIDFLQIKTGESRHRNSMNKKTKSELRSQFRILRKALTEDEITAYSQAIKTTFLTTEDYAQAECIYCYVSYNQEVQTMPLIEQCLRDGKTVLVPKVYGSREMHFFRLEHPKTELAPGTCGILEPVGNSSICEADYQHRRSILIVPGLVFDTVGNRIGYGGGYYDCFMQQHMDFMKIGLCYDFQVIPEHLTAEPTDVAVDKIITNKGILKMT